MCKKRDFDQLNNAQIVYLQSAVNTTEMNVYWHTLSFVR